LSVASTVEKMRALVEKLNNVIKKLEGESGTQAVAPISEGPPLKSSFYN
jgi:hypothetical protein